jgi:spore coat polysaccharide biosynthesis protein SpsF (cytidylyltransferase family)
MGSTRLPGKVLADLGGMPTLAFMLARLASVDVDRLVVATSDRPADDAIVGVAEAVGIGVVRGPEADVLARYAAVLDAYPADTVVRLTADCPLCDPALVSEVLGRHRAEGADYTSNILRRTFPDGLDVEVVAASALREADNEATDVYEREHVTPFIYRRPARYHLVNVESGDDLGAERWTLDTEQDLERLRDIVARLEDPIHAGWRDVLAVAGRIS